MTWTQTHRRLAVLHEVEEQIERQGGGPLPWAPAYAEVFVDRDALLVALHYQWRLRLQAQLDPALPTEELARTRVDLERRHRGLLRLLVGRSGSSGDAGGDASTASPQPRPA